MLFRLLFLCSCYLFSERPTARIFRAGYVSVGYLSVCCVVRAGSKETAFIYAVTSAGVVHAVTQACSSGNLTDCSCDSAGKGLETPEGWKWGGCR
jgi:hypothetical protein